MFRRRKSIIISLTAALLMSFVPYSSPMAEVNLQNNTTVNSRVYSTKPQDDFYEAVNGDWEKTAMKNINPQYDEKSTYTDISESNDKIIKEEFYKILADKNQYDANSDERKMINLYNNIINLDDRNKKGIEPIKKYLEKVNNIKNIDDLTSVLSDKEMDLFNHLIKFEVKNTDNLKAYEIYIEPTELGLGDSSKYSSNDSEVKKEKDAYISFLTNLLKESGYSNTEAREKIDKLFKLEYMIAPSILGEDELVKSKDTSKYKSRTNADELDSIAPNLKIKTIMQSLGVNNAQNMIIQDKNWLKSLNEIWTNSNLDLIKNYLEINIIENSGRYLSSNMSDAYYQLVEDVTEKDARFDSIEDEAYSKVNKLFPTCTGKLYLQKCFNDEEKQDVISLANEIKEAYKNKITKCDWINDSTRQAALTKLDKLDINVGFYTNGEDYSDIAIKSSEEGGTFFDNAINMSLNKRAKEISLLNTVIPKSISYVQVAPQESKAEYHYDTNSIILTPGILQPELYNINYSKEEKLATIGTVIAHEIGHSLDDLGVNYDSNGDYKSWLSTLDYLKFKQRINKVVEFYNGIEALPDKYIDGKTTLGENLADISGMSCTLDVLANTPNADYKKFFEKYAESFKSVMSDESQEFMLSYDTHSPAKYRVNAVVSQFEKFYDTYGITANDKMYVNPENRLKIWD